MCETDVLKFFLSNHLLLFFWKPKKTVTSFIKSVCLITITPAEASIALLGAVLRSVEALLCRLTGEAWQNQDLPVRPYCQSDPHDGRECEQQAGYTHHGDTNMCYTQVMCRSLLFAAYFGIIQLRVISDFNFCPQYSSLNMNKAEALPHEPGKEHIHTKVCCISKSNGMLYHHSEMILSSPVHLHVQSTAPCLSDHDLSKLVSISPLFKTLQEIQQSLQDLSTAELNQHLRSGTESLNTRHSKEQLNP